MGFENGKPTQGDNIELAANTPGGDAEPDVIAQAAVLTPADNTIIVRAASTGGQDKPFEAQIREMFGNEDKYVADSRPALRQSVNQELKEMEGYTGKKFPPVKSTDSYETVQGRVADMIAFGLGPQSSWSPDYKTMVMARLREGDPNITRQSATNQSTVYNALMAADRKHAVQVIGEAGRTASGQTLEDAVNRYQYRQMQKNGIKTDYN